jgi:hypothetical protein
MTTTMATTKMKMETTKEATTNDNNVDDNYEQAPTTNFMKITIITTETNIELSVTEPAATQDDDDEPDHRGARHHEMDEMRLAAQRSRGDHGTTVYHTTIESWRDPALYMKKGTTDSDREGTGRCWEELGKAETCGSERPRRLLTFWRKEPSVPCAPKSETESKEEMRKQRRNKEHISTRKMQTHRQLLSSPVLLSCVMVAEEHRDVARPDIRAHSYQKTEVDELVHA